MSDKLEESEMWIAKLEANLAKVTTERDELRAKVAELEAQRDEAIADSAEQAKIIGSLGDEVDGLKAKLGRVKDWAEPSYADEFAMMHPRAILSDTTPPLAVVSGYVWADFADEFSRYAFSVSKDQVDDFSNADDVHVPVTVIVMPRESEGK